MKRTIDVDTMWTNIYRQHNREQWRRRRNRYDRHSRTRRPHTAGAAFAAKAGD
jgi:hypothetical protein